MPYTPQKTVNIRGEDSIEEVEEAIEVAQDYMDKEDPTRCEVMVHICKAYTGKL